MGLAQGRREVIADAGWAARVGAGVEGRRVGIRASEGGSESGAPRPISPNTLSDPAED